MKQMIGILLLGLLVGCTSTQSLNGKYDIDKEYKARGTADALESVGKLPMPKEEFIEQMIENIKERQYEAEIDYPSLRVSINNPDKPTKTVVFNLEKADDTHYTATRADKPEVVLNYTYDPDQKTLSSITSKLIKR